MESKMIIYSNDTRIPIVFHYNKHHNIDANTPPWVIKCKGNTYYINHMDILPGVGFSTNENPDNEHTKGTLKIKGSIRIEEIDDRTIATIF
jgi:hypothetical protein